MLKNRVIPTLLLDGERLVKTRKFRDPKYVGDPINAIKIFNEKEVDEIIVIDISATRKKAAPNFALIEQMAGECFVPLAYGGGVAKIEHAQALFSLGVEKLCLQTACFENETLIKDIADRYGVQSVIASVDIKRDWLGRRRLFRADTRTVLGDNWVRHLARLERAGAGEILLNAVDADGTLLGPDFGLISIAAEHTTVPLIALGGIASLSDIRQAVHAGASAVAAGSFFVFHGPHRAVLITYPEYGELEELFSE